MSKSVQTKLHTSFQSMAVAPCPPCRSAQYYPQQLKEMTQWYTLSANEFWKGVAILKNNKAAGRDDVLMEHLKNLCPKAHRWLLTMLNKCFMEHKIPTLWRQSKIIAILKPGKDCDSKELPTNIPLVSYVQTL